MSELSSAAQAVMTAATGNTIIQQDPVYRQCIGAAIRAAADQVAPVDPYPNDGGWSEPRGESVEIRKKLLAIAAELKGAND